MKPVTILILLLAAAGSASAQLYNDAALTGDGNLLSDFSNQWYNTATGSYTGMNAAVFEHYGPSSGTFINNGTYTYGSGGMSDKFLGPNGAAGGQEIGGSSLPVFYDLVLNNGSSSTIAITAGNGMQVGNSLTFSNGITTTVRSNAATGAIKLIGGATYTGTMGAARHVNGYVSKSGNSAFTFPAGDGVQYRPLAYTTPPASATDQLSVAYFTGDPGTALDPTGGPHNRTSLNPSGTAGTTKLASVSPIGFWDWVALSGTGAISFTVSIPNMSVGGGYPTGSELRVVGWNTTTSQWDNLGGATTGTSTAAGTLLGGTVSNMANYSAIGIGSVSSTPLPLRLLSFSGKASGCRAELYWQTAAEKDVAYFSPERSPDGVGWIAIGRLAASGAAAHDYRFEDSAADKAPRYYRLRMVDRDGSFSYSGVVRVTSDCGLTTGIRVWPNPFGESLSIEGMAPGTAIKISSADGRLVYSGMADDYARIPSGTWPAGMYTVRVTRGTKEVSTVQVVKK